MEKDGPELQEALKEYTEKGRQNNTVGSFIEEFWNEAYLATPNDTVVTNLNPYFVLEASPDPKLQDQSRRAASLTFAAVKFASMLRREQLSPDTLRNGKPLCMDQFKVLFGASRQPKISSDGCDEVDVYNDSSHGT